MKRGQTSTEYMIIVAVVIVVAVVVSSILGDFPGMGSGTDKKVDDFKLSISKVGVEDYAVFDNYSLIKIRNNHFDTLTATAVNVNGEDCGDSNLPITLGIGKSYTLNCSVILEEGVTPDINIIWQDVTTGASYSTGTNATSSSSSEESSESSIPDCSAVSGLVSYWDFDDAGVEISSSESLAQDLIALWHLNGGSLTDVTGNFNANAQGGLDCSSDKGVFDGSCDFDGSTEYASTGYIPYTHTPEVGSIAMWFNRQAEGSFMFGAQTDNIGDPDYERFMIQGSSTSDFRIQMGSTTIDTGVAFNLNEWYHVAVTWNTSGNIVVYFDGVEVSSEPFTGDLPNSEAYMGALNNLGSPLETDCTLDEIAIWNRTISSGEVLELYKRGAPEDKVGSNNGSLIGALNTTGKVGSALDFDGSDDTVNVSTFNFDASSNSTYVFWLNTSNLATPQHVFGGDLWFIAASTSITFMDINALSYMDSNSELTSNDWHFVSIVYEPAATNSKIYLNGLDKTSQIHSPDYSSYSDMTFGGSGSPHTYYYNGSIDEFAVFDTALNSTEVLELYTRSNAGNPYCN